MTDPAEPLLPVKPAEPLSTRILRQAVDLPDGACRAHMVVAAGYLCSHRWNEPLPPEAAVQISDLIAEAKKAFLIDPSFDCLALSHLQRAYAAADGFLPKGAPQAVQSAPSDP